MTLPSKCDRWRIYCIYGDIKQSERSWYYLFEGMFQFQVSSTFTSLNITLIIRTNGALNEFDIGLIFWGLYRELIPAAPFPNKRGLIYRRDAYSPCVS
jgi:hypothetical protein